LLGSLLGALGIGIAFHSFQALGRAPAAGAVLVLLGATASAAGSSLARRARAVHPLWLGVHANGAGAVVLWALWMATDRGSPWPATAGAWLALGYMVLLGSVAAFLLYFWLLRQWSAARAAQASLLASLGAAGLGVALGEAWSWPTLAGGALVLAGAWLALRTSGRGWSRSWGARLRARPRTRA
jgi:drug/metabolite transporter (DMT)-like permease